MPRDGDGVAVRELGLLRGLGGDHVVSLLDAVPVSDPLDALALVMDRYDGGSLGSVVAARGRLTAGEIVTALSPVAAALGGLHRAGVVHGDLTPGNVLFDDTGRPAICDLGVTRLIGERTEEVFGTKGFVAPEVSVGGQPTTASDVYAVGALAWFCATGEAPEPGWLRQSSAETLADLPAALVAVIDSCLASDPADRPAAVELSVDLFQSAPAEAMRLPGVADEVESLTRRIRANAQASGQPEPAVAVGSDRRRWRRWWRREERPSRPTRPATTLRANRPTKSSPDPTPTRVAEFVAEPMSASPVRPAPGTPAAAVTPAAAGRHRARPVLSGAAIAILAAVFLTIGGLVAVAAGWEPSDVLPRHSPPSSTPRSAGSAGVAAPKTSQAAPTALHVDLRSTAAAVTDPRGTAQALADARAAVWTSGDSSRLDSVDAPGSDAWADDAQRVDEAATGGWRYQGVRFTVRSATVVAHTATTARVQVVLDSAAYAVVGPRGREQRAAATGQRVVLDLVHTTPGWRVSRVSV